MPDAPRILPPPAATLLVYAAFGWSVHLGDFSANGRPRMPPDASWLPELAALLTAPDGLAGLQELTSLGMRGWEVDASLCAVLPAAFAVPGLLDRFAALYPGKLDIIPPALMAAAPAKPPARAVTPALPKPAPTSDQAAKRPARMPRLTARSAA